MPAERLPEEPEQRYTIIKELGQGGMGTVYLAKDNEFNREVAIKRIRSDIPENEKSAYIKKFRNEIEVTGSLEFENIVRAYNVDKDERGNPFLVMECVRGETLEDKIEKLHAKGSKAGIRKMMESFSQVCDAVSKIHKKGHIHRDLKPGNIMITRTIAKVMDFGLAKKLEDDFQDEGIVGTPPYMSPEQADSKQASFQDDVWSLGAILYEILTGNTPFEGETTYNIIAKIINPKEKPKHPSKIVGGIERPPELCEIAMTALNRDKKKRYASAQEMANDIKAWLEYKPVSVYKESGRQAVRRTLRRSPWLKYVAEAATAVTLGALAIGAPIIYSQTHRAQQAEQETQKESEQRKQAEIDKENERIEKEKAQKQEKQAKEEKERAKEAEKKAKEAKENNENMQREKIERNRLARNAFDKGRDFLKRKDYENAEKYFGIAISIDDLADAHFEKGLSLYSRFRGPEAIMEFESANDSSMKESQKIHAQALFYAGFVNIDHLDDLKRAGEYFKELISKSTDNDDYFVMLAKSILAYREDRFEEAIRWTDTATEKYKNCWEGWLLRALFRMQGVGGSFSKLGLLEYRDFKTAFKSLDRALELNPGQIRCLEERIRLNCATSKPQAALKDAIYLVDTYPDVPAVRTSLGRVQHALGDYKNSIQTIDTAIRLGKEIGVENPPNYFVQGLNYQRLAELEHNIEYYKKSEEFFTQAVEASNRQPENLAYRASIRLKLKNLEGALEDLNEAIKKDPRDGKTHCTFGSYYAEKGETEKAISEFEKAISVRFCDAYRELGLFYITLGEKEKARKSLQTYIDKGMTEKRAEVIQKIQELEKE
ncbi:Serine/threonine-protein kinase PknD [uncultured archaeon]|nr:Serine/threonine-protein kinase PknD [uncultured archaeon]